MEDLQIQKLIATIKDSNDTAHDKILKAVNGGSQQVKREVRWDSIIIIILLGVLSWVYIDNLGETRASAKIIAGKLENVALIQAQVVTTQSHILKEHMEIKEDVKLLEPTIPRFSKPMHDNLHKQGDYD